MQTITKIINKANAAKHLYYINGTNGLAAIYVKQNSQANIYYAHTDHLGSIVKLTQANGTPVFSATYNAWGKQTITTNTFKFHRGYTGHEHLPEFRLINMNGRMYDPILGRMLSPDNYVQVPENAQNYNRYTYALNNPLIYTDPNGDKWWHWFLPVVDFLTGGAVSMTAITTATVTAASAMSTFPTAVGVASSLDYGVTFAGSLVNGPEWGGHRFNNSIRMLGGLFQTDPNRSAGARAWQLISRFSWEFFQTAGGYGYVHYQNAVGNVDAVEYAGGATFAINENATDNSYSMGTFIYIETSNMNHYVNGQFAPYNSPLFMHEYGHYIESQKFGPGAIYLGVCSYLDLIKSKPIAGTNLTTHKVFWTEKRANRNAAEYFGKYYNVDWSKYTNYPLP
jgi:RHS repeat-associated protein